MNEVADINIMTDSNVIIKREKFKENYTKSIDFPNIFAGSIFISYYTTKYLY